MRTVLFFLVLVGCQDSQRDRDGTFVGNPGKLDVGVSGVDPDIEVDRTPADALRGEDPQLERGITEVMTLLETWPQTPPDLGPTPNLDFKP